MSKGSFMHVPVTARRPREYQTIEYQWERVPVVGVWDQGDVFVKPLEWGETLGRKWMRGATNEARRLFQQAHDKQKRDEQRARERARAVNNEYFSQPHVRARLQREHAEQMAAEQRRVEFERKRAAQS